ncbi:ROK family transcriptional regulator [Chitinophaga pollutisoli]|uniref:ROK family transcriptional regulator n=1 Tax=Chitinophaga pollutisoli TaxID=3133966 RepID=A0ABZ2YL19_9BACT
MGHPTFFDELNRADLGGVAYKNLHLKKKILAWFTQHDNSTIADLSRELNASTPKVTHLLSDLLREGLVSDYGKIDSTGGRKPNIYGIAPDAGFFVGVEVKKFHVNIGLLDFKRNLVKITERIPYQLENTPASLDMLCEIIGRFLDALPVPREKVMGMGVNISGRIQYATGYSHNFFNFSEAPLSQVFESRTGIRTFLENDSRAMAFGEFSSGALRQEKNALFINLDHGIGLGILVNGQLYHGKSGFAGEFGHMPVFNNERMCHCGKKGCLETEASGQALIRHFMEKLGEGVTTIVQPDPQTGQVLLDDIIAAAAKGDILAIELIGAIGEKLGKGIAMLINLFNPELVILGGSMSATGDIIRLPIKSAINKYSLPLVNNDMQLVLSTLGEKAGVTGACLLVRNKLLSLA